MSGNEIKYIQRAFDENYITTLGSNLDEFEDKIKNNEVDDYYKV